MSDDPWKVDCATSSVLHLPTGMRVRFARDPHDSGAWDGKPENVPQALLDRAVIDGGKELARLMREAGDTFHHYLGRQRQ